MNFKTSDSQKSEQIPPFLVMDVLERAMEMAANGEEVIHLEVGEPDFDTADNIIKQASMPCVPGRLTTRPALEYPICGAP